MTDNNEDTLAIDDRAFRQSVVTTGTLMCALEILLFDEIERAQRALRMGEPPNWAELKIAHAVFTAARAQRATAEESLIKLYDAVLESCPKPTTPASAFEFSEFKRVQLH